MGDRSHIFDSCDGDSGSLQGADSRFPSTTGALNIHLDSAQPIAHCSVSCVSGSHLGSIGCPFPGTFEPCSTTAPPGYNVALHISDGNHRIVKRGLDEDLAFANPLMGPTSLSLLRHLLTLPLYFLATPRLCPRPATVFFGPFLVRALVRVLCP